MINKQRESVVFTTIAQVSLYVIKLLGVWIFFRGHNEPGGGFIAGLVIAAAVALQGVAFGHKAAERLFPFHFSGLLGSGLAIALLTLLVPPFFGYPPMKSAFDYIQIPLIGQVEWATAAVFDLGVFLVVVGTVKTVLLHIAEEKSQDQQRSGEHDRGARSGARQEV